MILYLSNSALDSDVRGWTIYDGTGQTYPTTGDSETPPYPTGLAAMQDGWRVIQMPQLLPPAKDLEYTTSLLQVRVCLREDGGGTSMTSATVNPELLLTTNQMASFAARGFLRFNELVPENINRRVVTAFDTGPVPRPAAGSAAVRSLRAGSPLDDLMHLPAIQGIVQSLVVRIRGSTTTRSTFASPTRAGPKACTGTPSSTPGCTSTSS